MKANPVKKIKKAISVINKQLAIIDTLLSKVVVEDNKPAKKTRKRKSKSK